MGTRKITIIQVILLPFSLIYRWITELRNLLFDWGVLTSEEFHLPVISVGNITVGGTGKTPHTEYLIRLLKDEFNLATLSRGYKRKTKNFHIAEIESSSEEVGDEPKQMKTKFPNITVAVDRKRVNGIHQLLKQENPIDLILLDDAFQHRHVKPGKSILLIDYNRMIHEDFLLPAGRLRESVSSKKRADIILITKSPDRIKPIEMRNIASAMKLDLHQHLFFTNISYDQFVPVFKTTETKTPEDFKQQAILLLSGIANPRGLKKYARSISTNIDELIYPDHHQYTKQNIKTIQEKYSKLHDSKALILTTEKDAMRLQDIEVPEEIKRALYYVSIRVNFLNEDQEEFNSLILNYARSNKRNSLLHQEQD